MQAALHCIRKSSGRKRNVGYVAQGQERQFKNYAAMGGFPFSLGTISL